MDINEMKRLIRHNIVDFTELVLNNYNKLGLDETDAVIIIKLSYLLNKNVNFIQPKQLAEMLSISPQTTSKRLNNLMDRGFVKIKLAKDARGKETETFDLDHIILRILKEDFENKEQTSDHDLVSLFEDEFQKILSPLDIQIINKWIDEDNYTKDQIKEALFKAVKANRRSINYVDGILLKTEYKQSKPKAKIDMKDLKKLWEE